MSEISDQNSVVTLKVDQWRTWLSENHVKKDFVWQVKYKKHTGKASPSHRDSMDEAICFGWIDSTIKRIDEEKYAIRFVKRNENSRWSKATVSHAKRLIREKRMRPAGLEQYKKGLKKPLHDADLPEVISMPEELKRVLFKNPKAERNFERLAPSYKKQCYKWVFRAKKPETKLKRIKQIIKSSLENKKLFQDRSQVELNSAR